MGYEDFLKRWREGKRRLELKLTPENGDDLWHLYNLIEVGDWVYARTSRVLKVNEPYSRPKRGERVSLDLKVEVEKVVWDRFSDKIRIHGVVKEAPEEFNVTGSHHTLSLAVDKPFILSKEFWRKHHIERLELSMKARAQPIIVVSIDDEDLCVAVIREFGVEVKFEEKTKLPGKLEVESRERMKVEFFKRALSSIEEITSEVNGKIVVIGPGFIKNEFVDFLKRRSERIAEEIIDVKSVNSAGVGGVYEALRSGVLSNAISKIRLSVEMDAINEVLKRLGKGSGDVAYGMDDVEKAAELGAVEEVLVLDALIKEVPEDVRRRLEKIMGCVESKGGRVLVLSSRNEAGMQLESLGGISAILRYALFNS